MGELTCLTAANRGEYTQTQLLAATSVWPSSVSKWAIVSCWSSPTTVQSRFTSASQFRSLPSQMYSSAGHGPLIPGGFHGPLSSAGENPVNANGGNVPGPQQGQAAPWGRPLAGP